MGRTGSGGCVSGDRTQGGRCRLRRRQGRGDSGKGASAEMPVMMIMMIMVNTKRTGVQNMPGKLFRMIMEPTKLHLPRPLQCLKYPALQGECPERQRGRTVNPLA